MSPMTMRSCGWLCVCVCKWLHDPKWKTHFNIRVLAFGIFREQIDKPTFMGRTAGALMTATVHLRVHNFLFIHFNFFFVSPTSAWQKNSIWLLLAFLFALCWFFCAFRQIYHFRRSRLIEFRSICFATTLRSMLLSVENVFFEFCGEHFPGFIGRNVMNHGICRLGWNVFLVLWRWKIYLWHKIGGINQHFGLAWAINWFQNFADHTVTMRPHVKCLVSVCLWYSRGANGNQAAFLAHFSWRNRLLAIPQWQEMDEIIDSIDFGFSSSGIKFRNELQCALKFCAFEPNKSLFGNKSDFEIDLRHSFLYFSVSGERANRYLPSEWSITSRVYLFSEITENEQQMPAKREG